MAQLADRKALVLGGGGVAGIAWETGLLAGLAAAGLDLRDADLIAGTSAGATVGAQMLTGRTLWELYEAQIDPDAGIEPEMTAVDFPAALGGVRAVLEQVQDPIEARRQIGRIALRCDRVSPAARRAIIAARIGDPEWPSQDLKLCTVDVDSGAFVVLDRACGARLVDAVTASCAVPGLWPVVTIAGRRLMDGGVRSTVNADIARGYGRVIVLEVLSGPVMADVMPLGEHQHVMLIRPDDAACAVLTPNIMDPRACPATARAGFAQGEALADELHRFWR